MEPNSQGQNKRPKVDTDTDADLLPKFFPVFVFTFLKKQRGSEKTENGFLIMMAYNKRIK